MATPRKAPRKAPHKSAPPTKGPLGVAPPPAPTQESLEDRVAKLERQMLTMAQAVGQLAAQVAGPSIQQQLGNQVAEALAKGDPGSFTPGMT